MSSQTVSWRGLYIRMEEVDSPATRWPAILREWVGAHPELLEELRGYGAPGAHLRPLPDGYADLYQLYALSRVIDLLLIPYQGRPEVDLGWEWEQPPSRADYPAFCAAIGATRIPPRAFHPFFHEIVEVRQAEDPDQPPAIVEEAWPGYLLGTLLLTRAGVRVSAGANHLVAGVADRSCLYWTYLRVQRPTNDLSMGWGSNSQWRTDFRRDHVVDGTLFYNVDAGFEPEQDDDPPPLDVLRHRCSTVTDLGDDLWPYYLFHSEPLDP